MQESFAEKTAEPMQISAQDAVDSHLECVKYMTIYICKAWWKHIWDIQPYFIPFQEKALPDQTVEIPDKEDSEQNKEESFCKCYFLTFLEVSQLEFFELLWNIWGAGKLC